MEAYIWLGLMILFLIVEIITVGLTSIWFAGGALAALISVMLGANIWIQIGIFLAVSFLLLYFTRPFAMKYINRNRLKSNYEGIIGKRVRINETVDNMNQTGSATVNGQEWTVRAREEKTILPSGSIASVVGISGVKLIVEPCEEEVQEAKQ